MNRVVAVLVSLFFTASALAQSNWPAITQSSKPWARWWWMGSAVDAKNLSAAIAQYYESGLGGMEIVPIYGVKGQESQSIAYLSPQWMQMLDHTVKESNRYDMGIYISVGSGWPIGGAHVTHTDAASKLVVQQYQVKAGASLADKIVIADAKQAKVARLSTVIAFNKNNEATDITQYVNEAGTLQYNFPADATVYALFDGKTLQAVKRAAPGGEGLTIDHFSLNATNNYFSIFDKAFGSSSHGVKGFFNDSYEVFGANWTPQFFKEFEKRRGYDLKQYFQQFYTGVDDIAARLKSDYRLTVSELMTENFATAYTNWTHKRNALSVNQAHGSPGNLLDIYGAFDVPETETFGSSYFPIKGLRRDTADVQHVDPDPNMSKFASSAAHAYGKPLVSSETFTWLAEHFKTSWSQCKPEVDQLFLSGVNHVFYHGTTYSPQDAVWPGWQFYASVQFNPTNSLWPHLKGLNQYIARCQAVLQEGAPDNELLVYWPVFDVWDNAKGMDMALKVHNVDKWLHPTSFNKNIVALQADGYSLDYVSDKMIAASNFADGRIAVSTKGAKHKVLIIPACNKMPEETIEHIFRLARQGATIIMEGLPEDVPGFADYDQRRANRKRSLAAIDFKEAQKGIAVAKLGQGSIVKTNDVKAALTYLSVKGEKMVDAGLKFIRRTAKDGIYYFIVNQAANDVDKLIDFNTNASTLIYMNPLDGQLSQLPFKKQHNGTQARIQLKSGQSALLKFSNATEKSVPAHIYETPKGSVIELGHNKWELSFKEGGPQLPATKILQGIQPWTSFKEDSSTQSFSGTGLYSTSFVLKTTARDYVLRLSQLHESARVWVNGQDAGLVWSLPYELKIGKFLKQGNNTIKIEVCNLMANRIRNMDRNGQVWRNYHEINFVNVRYKNFDASDWKVQPSGISGKVTIIPLQ